MSETEKSILKSVACYEALGKFPLTATEIYRYLQKESLSQKPPSFFEISNLLSKSPFLNQKLENWNGFYFFKGNQNLCQKRINHYKTSSFKWKKIRRLGIFLNLVPFFRGAAINGSLAIDNAGQKSDIDFLVFAKKGRIWTCRLLLGFFLQLLGQRRHGKIIANKICLNHYVAGPPFVVPIKNTPNAQLYCRLVPFINYAGWRLFQEQNLFWLKDFIFLPSRQKEKHLRQTNEKARAFKITKGLGSFFELILELTGAGTIEKILGQWQKKRIMSKIKQQPISQDELILEDTMLVFHYPICKNREVVKAYTKRVNSIND